MRRYTIRIKATCPNCGKQADFQARGVTAVDVLDELGEQVTEFTVAPELPNIAEAEIDKGDA